MEAGADLGGGLAMRRLAEMRGLRFPDVQVVRMFFKEGLHHRTGEVLELGCGNGSNLIPFAEFGWNITGLDLSEAALADARHNFCGAGRFEHCDLAAGLRIDTRARFDVILLPNVAYYLPRTSFVRVLQQCREHMRPNGVLFLITRTPEDWRWGRGQEVEPGGYRLDCRETGEFGLLNVFYGADDLSALVREHFGELREPQLLFATVDNPQGGVVVRNADVILWGRAAAT